MDAKVFFAEASKGAWRRVYLLEGEEEYAKDRAIDVLIGGIPEDLRDFNVDALDNPSLDTLMELSRTSPMLGPKRLILVRDSALLGRGEGDAKRFAAFLPEIPDSSCVVLVQRGKADKRKTLYKAIDKLGGTVSFNPYSEGEAVRWAVRYAGRKGVELPPAHAQELVEMVGSGTGDIAAELDKLCDYADGQGSITGEMLKKSVRPRLEYGVFTMLEHFLAGRSNAAFAQLDASIRAEGASSVYQLMAFFAGRLRAMLMARRLLSEGRKESEILSAMGGSPYAAKKSLQAAKAFSLETLEEGLLLLAEADYQGKTGQRSPREALETALVRIFVGK